MSPTCRHLHLFENDCKPFRAYSLDDANTDEERIAARRGLPYILFHLPVGEESQYSLLRRTLDQYLPLTHRTLHIRHARLHWAASPANEKMKLLLRATCRMMHFDGFTELTHKHRFHTAIKRRRAALDRQVNSSSHASFDAWSHGSAAFAFYPETYLLPTDRHEFLASHRALNGLVDAELEKEAITPAPIANGKARRKEARRKQLAEKEAAETKQGETKENHEDADPLPSSSPSSSPSPSDSTSSVASPSPLSSSPIASPSPSPSSSSTNGNVAVNWQQFVMPDFLSSYPQHWTIPTTLSPSSSSSSSPLWLLKPYSRGGGSGIILTDLYHHVKPDWITTPYVATRYVDQPLLIDKSRIPNEIGELILDQPTSASTPTASKEASTSPSLTPSVTDLRKFDLRLYVLLLSPFFPPAPSVAPNSLSLTDSVPPFPFQVYLYNDGLVRFASRRYDASQLSPDKLGTKMDQFVHLTNNSINVNNDSRRSQEKGCWENTDLKGLKKYFEEEKAKASETSSSSSSSSTFPYAWDWSYITRQIHHLVVHSLLVSDDYLAAGVSPSNRWSFQLLGLDCLIDQQFRVHLCEWNSLPDLNSSTPGTQYHLTFPVDHRVKSNMLADLLTTLQFRVSGEEEECHDPFIDQSDGTTRLKHTSTTTPHAINQRDTVGGFQRII